MTRQSSVDERLKQWATTDRQREYVDAVNANGGIMKAAKALGISFQVLSDGITKLKRRAAVDGYKPGRFNTLPTPAPEAPADGPRPGKRILVLPDVQAKPGTDFSYLMRIGQYAVEKKPDIIVCIGDFADMPSLSSYDKGKKSFEGRRYKRDIDASHEAMSAFLTPIVDYNAAHPREEYTPRMVMTLGNHEERILRAVNDDPKLDGVLSMDDLKYKDFGWEVHPFLEVVILEGVAFSHFFTTGVMGRPVTTAQACLTKKHMSCVQGHQQGLQMATGYRGDGTLLTSIIAGSCYEHDEQYLGPQGNKHWRGFLMLHAVRDGTFDVMPVSLEFINQRYPHIKVAPDYSREHYPEGMR